MRGRRQDDKRADHTTALTLLSSIVRDLRGPDASLIGLVSLRSGAGAVALFPAAVLVRLLMLVLAVTTLSSEIWAFAVLAGIAAVAQIAFHFGDRTLIASRATRIVAVQTALSMAIIAGGLATAASAPAALAFAAILAVEFVVVFPLPLIALATMSVFVPTLALAGLNALPAPIGVAAFGAVFASVLMRRVRIDAARDEGGTHVAQRRAISFLRDFEEFGRAWFWETDADGTLTYVSPALTQAVGVPTDALVGRRLAELVREDGGDGERSGRGLAFNLSSRLTFSEIEVNAADVSDLRWSLSGKPVTDRAGKFIGFRGLASDLTAIRRSEAEVTRLARFDGLTGLANRASMRACLDRALSATGKTESCALMLLDLDQFKAVNDTLGHPIGDELLKQVGDRLRAVVGEMGQVGRLGGDEFEVLLPRMGNRFELEDLAKRLIQRVSATYYVDGLSLTVGASIGIAIAPKDATTPDALVRNVDLALYAAKAAGRGVHRFYQATMHDEAKDRQALERDLRSALGNGELSVLYQPVVGGVSNAIVSFEALLRWNHPRRGAVSPSQFVPIAEEMGIITEIGEWVLRTACAEAAQWPAHVRVAVNISPIQFAQESLPAVILNTLASTGLAPGRLELELTEGVFLQADNHTEAMFTRLFDIGVGLALDDFGTGYSSLGYLQRAPFGKIKIDQSFVRGADVAGNSNAAIIKAIVSLADSLGMVTTAEGVETADDLALIRSLGCTQVQGYVFGKAVAADAARAMMAKDHALVVDERVRNRTPRMAILRSAMMTVGGRAHTVRLRNIAAGGAMVDFAHRIAEGEEVCLQLPDAPTMAGVVRWAAGGRIGVAFAQPFDMTTIEPARRAMRRPALRSAA